MDAGALALLVVAAVELVGLVVLATLLLGLRRRQRGTDVQRHDVEVREHRVDERAERLDEEFRHLEERGEAVARREPGWPRSRRSWWSRAASSRPSGCGTSSTRPG